MSKKIGWMIGGLLLVFLLVFTCYALFQMKLKNLEQGLKEYLITEKHYKE